ncbi:helix-turn-helix domain-containing protein [Staphylococcus cohnii]|uniref:helix-turn-helix domain-containing protein n=1 Tax=Staphylococcus cohnii TaxID=29382 RepID=UPI000D1C9A9B|nr:helix-turn-helix transcriptional regulator [Staphylococcus cohnii]PTE78366.1 transcriptional regulator [Staphylococcus cohnii]PTF36503.1 transcriptional regulator [Staphylococcus cohnii]
MTLGKVIKNHRLSKGETQTEYGKRFGAVKSLISHWEQDLNKPNPRRLKMIADDMEITVTELLEGERND